MDPHLCSKLLTRAVQETVHQIHKHPSPTFLVSSFQHGFPKNDTPKNSRKHTSCGIEKMCLKHIQKRIHSSIPPTATKKQDTDSLGVGWLERESECERERERDRTWEMEKESKGVNEYKSDLSVIRAGRTDVAEVLALRQ